MKNLATIIIALLIHYPSFAQDKLCDDSIRKRTEKLITKAIPSYLERLHGPNLPDHAKVQMLSGNSFVSFNGNTLYISRGIYLAEDEKEKISFIGVTECDPVDDKLVLQSLIYSSHAFNFSMGSSHQDKGLYGEP